MTRTIGRRSVAALLLALVGLAPVAPSLARAQPAPDGYLSAALAMAPAGANAVYFTDWSLIKRYEDATGLTSKSPLAARLRFLRSTYQGEAVASAYGFDHFAGHADAWSWDSTDLLWETTLDNRNGPPAYVLAFRADFDFAPVVAHLIARGFTRGNYHGIPIYAHKMDISAPWLQTTDFGILNTAVLADRKMLVLSSSPRIVPAVLDAYGGRGAVFSANAGVAATAARLGTVAAAIVAPGVATCRALGGADILAKLPAGQAAVVRKLLRSRGQLHPYEALGLGYRYEDTTSSGTRTASAHSAGLVVMHYADARTAAADLAPRRAIATDGRSLVTNLPYREGVFTVLGAAADRGDLTLQLRPAHDQPRRLFEMFVRRDMIFAGC